MTRARSQPKRARRAMPAPTASSPSSTVPAMRRRTPRVKAQRRRSKYMSEPPHNTPDHGGEGQDEAERLSSPRRPRRFTLLHGREQKLFISVLLAHPGLGYHRSYAGVLHQGWPRAPRSWRGEAVNPSRVFILQPIATTLLTVAVLLAGAVAYTQLPISALPQVDYPTIQVLTFYPGASPDVMASSVTSPLERQFGQLPGLKQMTSTSSFGASLITLQFTLEHSIDMAEQEVQAAINVAATYLPRDLPNPPIYSKVNPADTPILTLALTSDTLPLAKVQDLADTRLAQKISQLPGVGLVSISGGQRPAVRIQVNPTALAAYGMSLEDLRNAIAVSNVNQAKGNFDGTTQAYTIGANDQLLSSDDYRKLVVAYRDGAPVRLSDVADVKDDAENVKQAAWIDGAPAVIMNIQRQ